MMADGVSLNELIARFRTLQQIEHGARINDRNAVEVVSLLCDTGMLELVICTNGQGYVTRGHILKEVRDEVALAGGRLNVVELPNLIHVDTAHIERAVATLKATCAGEGWVEVNGDIMTRQYIGYLMRESSSRLRERGSFTMTEFAKRFQLPMSFVVDCLSQAVRDGELRAIINGDTLYTSSFVAAQRRKLLCALIGSCGPVNVASLHARHKILPSLASPLGESLGRGGLEQVGRVDGLGPNATFIPLHTDVGRQQRLQSLLQLNGYLPFEMLRVEGITDGVGYMQKTFNPPVANGPSALEVCSIKGRPGTKGRPRGGMKGPQNVLSGEQFAVVTPTVEYPLAGYALTACFVSDCFFQTLVGVCDRVASGESVAVGMGSLLPHCGSVHDDAPRLMACFEKHFPTLIDSCMVVGSYFVNRHAIAKYFSSTHQLLIVENITSRSAAQQRLRGRLGCLLMTGSPEGDYTLFLQHNNTINHSKNTINNTTTGKSVRMPMAQGFDDSLVSMGEMAPLSDLILAHEKVTVDALLKETCRSKKQRDALATRDLEATMTSLWMERWVGLSMAVKGIAWLRSQTCRSASDSIEEAVSTLTRALLLSVALPMLNDLYVSMCFAQQNVDEWCTVYGVTGLDTSPSVGRLYKAMRRFSRHEGCSVYLRLLEHALPSGEISIASCDESPSDAESDVVDSIDPPNLNTAQCTRTVEGFVAALSEACSSGELPQSSFHTPNRKAEREVQSRHVEELTAAVTNGCFGLCADVQESVALLSDMVGLLLAVRHRCYFYVRLREAHRYESRSGVYGELLRSCVTLLDDSAISKGFSLIDSSIPLSGEDRVRLDALRTTILSSL